MYQYIYEKEGKYYNTYNNAEVDIISEVYENISSSKFRALRDKFNKRYNITLFPYIVYDHTFYAFDVITDADTVCLCVYSSTSENAINWKEEYRATIKKNVVGIIENGSCDIDFWHEYFATNLCNSKYNEFNVNMFALNDFTMKNVRRIFTTQLQPNAFLFFKQYMKLKKVNQKEYNTCLFDIPLVKFNRNIGKAFNGQYINFAYQREIFINNEPFFDITVASGTVTDGVLNIENKNRFFITEDYAYSPDDGDLEVLVKPNTFGLIFDSNMRKMKAGLMLNNYNGSYYYQYFFSKTFIPAFEILAKAGYSKIADLLLDQYYFARLKEDIYNHMHNAINLFGRNAQEIFGFKLNKFNAFCDSFFSYYKKFERMQYNSLTSKLYFNTDDFLSSVINKIKYMIDIDESIFSIDDIDVEIFRFIEDRLKNNTSVSTIKKYINYLRKSKIGDTNLYRDYLNMCFNVKWYSGGLFPKNLKYEHDVMVNIVNQMKEAKNNKYFKERVEEKEYTENIYIPNGQTYCILAPRKSDDLVEESKKLHHCVRSYIQRVSEGDTKIYFLRNQASKSLPLVTIEVVGNRICQVRGKYNRDINCDEENFIEEWADEKNLVFNLYRW